jgi:hypothetical protein
MEGSQDRRKPTVPRTATFRSKQKKSGPLNTALAMNNPE